MTTAVFDRMPAIKRSSPYSNRSSMSPIINRGSDDRKHGNSSVLVERDRIYFKTAARLQCLNAQTGALIFATREAKPHADQRLEQMLRQIAAPSWKR